MELRDGRGGGGGGAVFVMSGAGLTIVNGSFDGNTVANGTGFVDGSAYGPDAFLGGNITFQIDAGKTVALGNLGGAGNLSDANVARNASDPNANGGISKTGQGTLALYGMNYYTGATVVNAGTLVFGAEASEDGTSRVVVGQNPSDDAILVLGENSSLMLGGFNGTSGNDAPVLIAESNGSSGSIVIGSGSGSSGAFIGARIFEGVNGTASLVFTQDFATGSGNNTLYPFYTTLTGNLSLFQNGNGTTQLHPLYGENSFTGSVTVNSGTLATTGSTDALAGAIAIAVNTDAVFQLGQSNGINNAASLVLNGGALENAMTLSESMGPLTISAASIINLTGNSSLTFSTLAISGPLAIWNYTAEDFLRITSGTASGDVSQILFYSNNGQTFLGTGGFSGQDIIPVPEPSIYVLLGGIVIVWSGLAKRRWTASTPVRINRATVKARCAACRSR